MVHEWCDYSLHQDRLLKKDSSKHNEYRLLLRLKNAPVIRITIIDMNSHLSLIIKTP